MIGQQERSESIERAALESLHRHCPEKTRRALGLFSEVVGDALVAGASKDPSILLNRCLGLGTNRPAGDGELARIASSYREQGVGRYFLHTYEGSVAGGEEALAKVGLVPARGWMKFERGTEPSPKRSCDLEIRRADSESALHFGTIVAGAFGMTEAAAPLLAGMVADPRWHLFVSYEGETPAGAGGLFVEDQTAWLEWGATHPSYRRRGSQGAIMQARINAALALGCTAMFTETGEAVGADPQHSYGNIQRFGFKECVLRQNWAPPS